MTRNGLLSKILAALLALSFVISSNNPIIVTASETADANQDDIIENLSEDAKKKNAINMLNYVVSMTEEVQASSDSKIYLDEVFQSVTNNIHPNAVDSVSLRQVRNLLDTIKSYRMVAAKKERLEYIYEKNKAQAYREAIPNPVGLLSLATTRNPLKAVASVAYMALDAKSSYDSAVSNADKQFLEESWKLEDDAYEILADSSSELFEYMVKMVTVQGLEGDLTLNQEMVKDFVEWKNKDNPDSKIMHFEAYRNSYPAFISFGPYWLELAKCYYDVGEYDKCLNAVTKYQSLDIQIFRKDEDYASILPIAIVAAREVYSDDKYYDIAQEYCSEILKNATDDNWSLRYFVAETYMTLYAKTNDKDFLYEAYNLIKNNVNNLYEEQEKLNRTYLAEVTEKKAGSDATPSQKKEISAYNKMLKDVRKTELVPISEPLLLNCELLKILTTKMDSLDNNKTKADRTRLDSIIHSGGNALFLMPNIDNLYWFATDKKQISAADIEVSFNKDTIEIPAMYVSDETDISVVLNKEKTYTDWTLSKVIRKKGASIDTFISEYNSKSMDKADFSDGDTIEITITQKDLSGLEPLTFEFKVSRSKKVSVLDNWNWLNNASSWTDTIVFERVNN